MAKSVKSLTPTSRNVNRTAWDLLFTDALSAPSRALANTNIIAGADAASAVDGADLIISAVTAAATVDAAKASAPGLKAGAWFFDVNSVAPGTKKTAAQIIHDAGGRYIEAAIMSPIAPKRIATTILLGGPHAAAFAPIAARLGLTASENFSSTLGQAAAAKMCRSVMVKGIEALLAESLLSARHYGVEQAVIGSLEDILPGPNWNELARYMISRSLQHGMRRAEEMREAARTVLEAGIEPLMSVSCSERQEWAAGKKDAMEESDLASMLDAMRDATEAKKDAPQC